MREGRVAIEAATRPFGAAHCAGSSPPGATIAGAELAAHSTLVHSRNMSSPTRSLASPREMPPLHLLHPAQHAHTALPANKVEARRLRTPLSELPCQVQPQRHEPRYEPATLKQKLSVLEDMANTTRPSPAQSDPRPVRGLKAKAVWTRLASLDNMLEPSPLTRGVPVRVARERVVSLPSAGGEGGWFAGGWQVEAHRPWLERLRQELNIAYNISNYSTSRNLPPAAASTAHALASQSGPKSSPLLARSPPSRPPNTSPTPPRPDFSSASTLVHSSSHQNKLGSSAVTTFPSTANLPPIRHRLKSGGTIEIVASPDRPVLLDLRTQSSRALLISDDGQLVSVFDHLGPGPLVLVSPTAVHKRADLPSAYERVYALAERFVEGVRARQVEVSQSRSEFLLNPVNTNTSPAAGSLLLVPADTVPRRTLHGVRDRRAECGVLPGQRSSGACPAVLQT